MNVRRFKNLDAIQYNALFNNILKITDYDLLFPNTSFLSDNSGIFLTNNIQLIYSFFKCNDKRKYEYLKKMFLKLLLAMKQL